MKTSVFGTALCAVIVIWLNANGLTVSPLVAFGFYLFGRLIGAVDESEHKE